MTLPQPHRDPAPEDFPGGTDAVADYVEPFPYLTPDPPVLDPTDESGGADSTSEKT